MDNQINLSVKMTAREDGDSNTTRLNYKPKDTPVKSVTMMDK